MINVTVGALMEARPIFQKIANTPMTAKDCFSVLSTLKSIETTYNTINDTIQKITEKYSTTDTKPNTMRFVSDDAREQCEKEINSFLQDIISVDCEKVPQNVLNNLKISPIQLLAIENFLQ